MKTIVFIFLLVGFYGIAQSKEEKIYTSADQKCKNGDFKGAIEEIDDYLNKKGFSCEVANLGFLKAMAQLSSGELDKGMSSLSLVINKCKESDYYAKALDQRARVNLHLQKYDESISDWEELLELAPKDELTYLLLFKTLYSVDNSYKMKSVLKKMKENGLDSKTTFFFLASTYYLDFGNDKVKALENLNNAISSKSNDTPSMIIDALNELDQNVKLYIDEFYSESKKLIDDGELLEAKTNLVLFKEWAEAWSVSKLEGFKGIESKKNDLICTYNKGLEAECKNLKDSIEILKNNYTRSQGLIAFDLISTKLKRLDHFSRATISGACELNMDMYSGFFQDYSVWVEKTSRDLENLLDAEKEKKAREDWIAWNRKQPWAKWTEGTYNDRAKYQQRLADFFASTEWVGGDGSGKGKTIRKGKRGGKYYYSAKGNKVYVSRNTPHQVAD
jgi:tetratricopeptide (TPR) repeat protein